MGGSRLNRFLLATFLSGFGGPICGESVVSFPVSPTPAFVENRIQGDIGYSHALSPAGWLIACNGFAIPELSRISGPLRLYRWDFEGARPACAVSAFDFDGAYEHFYFGRDPRRIAESLPRFRALQFYDAWPGVNVRYHSERGALLLTLEATAPGAFAQVRFHNPPEGFIQLTPPPADATQYTYNLGPLPSSPTPTASATGPDGTIAVVMTDHAWPGLDASTEVCKLTSQSWQSCPGVGVATYGPKSKLRSLTWIRGSRHQYSNHVDFDQGSNFMVAGSTFSRDFPTTSGKIQPEYAGPERMAASAMGIQPGGDVFVVKLHGPTGLLIHSTLLGTEDSEFPHSFASDNGGRAYIGVSRQMLLQGTPPVRFQVLNEDATALDYSFPLTANSIAQSVSPEGWVVALDALPDLTTLQLSVLDRTGNAEVKGVLAGESGEAHSLVRTQDGAIWVLNGAKLLRLPAGESSFQLVESAAPRGALHANPDGSITFLARPDGDEIPEAARPSGGALLADPCPNSRLAIRYSPSGSVLGSTWLPAISIAPAQQYTSGLSWLDNRLSQWTRYLFDWNSPPRPFLACAYTPGRPSAIAPGSLVRFRGYGIGSSVPVDLPAGPDGRLVTKIQDVSATVNGLEMPILSAGPGAIDVVVPQAATSPNPSEIVELRLPQLDLSEPVNLAKAAPHSLDGYRGQLILNQNGEPNSAENPARVGEILTFSVGGIGRLSPTPPEGVLHYPDPPQLPVIDFGARLYDAVCEVLEVIQIEGLPPGMVRVKVRLPPLAHHPVGLNRTEVVFGNLSQGSAAAVIPIFYLKTE